MLLVSKSHRTFWLRRLHSVTGVVPVGAFLAAHLWINARVMQGRPAFDRTVSSLQHVPWLGLFEVVGILLPLAVHATIGVALTLRSRPNVRRYPLPRNWSYTLSRVTGIVTLVFLVYHLSAFRLPVALGELTPADLSAELERTLSTTTAGGVPVAALAYLIGVAATCHHLASGLATFCSTWGLTVTPAGTRVARAAAGALGIALFLAGAGSVVHHATGGVPGLGASP